MLFLGSCCKAHSFGLPILRSASTRARACSSSVLVAVSLPALISTLLTKISCSGVMMSSSERGFVFVHLHVNHHLSKTPGIGKGLAELALVGEGTTSILADMQPPFLCKRGVTNVDVVFPVNGSADESWAIQPLDSERCYFLERHGITAGRPVHTA